MEKISIETDTHRLVNIANINIILGRNGSGKSRFLRHLDMELARQVGYNVSYISPERAGIFKKQGHIDTNMENDPEWLRSSRSMNQSQEFKTTSASLLREVETLYLRRLQDSLELRNNEDIHFKNDVLDKMNALLSNIMIVQEGSSFLFKDYDGETVTPENISSGESEVIALATEVLYFFEKLNPEKFNLLLIDEPDVHLHPDLQSRLANFLLNQIEELSPGARELTALCIATHSTPLVCALAVSDYTSLGNKEFKKNEITLTPVTDNIKKIAPFFGHPLSLTFNNDPLLILEGEDDERIWQQAARTSQGKIKLFPILATSVDQQSSLEKFCAKVLPSVYDNPLAYSLRDGDGATEALESIGPVIRFRLNCYAAENLLLSDECLELMDTSWEGFIANAHQWIGNNEGHKDLELIRELMNSNDRFRNQKIKSIRQLICTISKSNKPWEVVVGQAIARLEAATENEYSLYAMIGSDACEKLLGINSIRPIQVQATKE
ncbi:MAG: ATP-binding protein [Parapedobacter sp.]|nr:MAG: ATP-binding protein [Parapedobacter sp.]